MQNIRVAALRLKSVLTGIASASYPGVDVQLAERMLTALTGMTAHAWPDQVYALSKVD
jgi:hypothetical protein